MEEFLITLKESMRYRFRNSKHKHRGCSWLWEHICTEDGEEIHDGALEVLARLTIEDVLIFLQGRHTLNEASIYLGKKIADRFGLRFDSLVASRRHMRVGVRILQAYCNDDREEVDIQLLSIKIAQKNKTDKGGDTRHPTYVLVIKDAALYNRLWDLVDINYMNGAPNSYQSADWVNSIHQDGQKIVPLAYDWVLDKISLDKTLEPVRAINNLQSVPYRINNLVFDVYLTLFKQVPVEEILSEDFVNNPLSPFPHLREPLKRQRHSKFLQADKVCRLGNSQKDTVLYHKYHLSFIGNPQTPYLHTQDKSVSMGILCYENSVQLGSEGAHWMCIYTAKCFGGMEADTLSHKADWVSEQHNQLMDYALDPYLHDGWQQAKYPWAFLACCYELHRLSQSIKAGHPIEEFESKLPIYISSEHTSLIHLCCMAYDDISAKFIGVNTLDKDKDIYSVVSKTVWQEMDAQHDQLDPRQRFRAKQFLEKLYRLKHDVAVADDKDIAYGKLERWREKRKDIYQRLFYLYWRWLSGKPELQRAFLKDSIDIISSSDTKQRICHALLNSVPEHYESEEIEYTFFYKMYYVIEKAYKQCLEKPYAISRTLMTRVNDYTTSDESVNWQAPVTNFPISPVYENWKKNRVKISFCGHGGEYVDMRIKAGRTFEYCRNATISLTVQAPAVNTINKIQHRANVPNHMISSFDAAHTACVFSHTAFPVSHLQGMFGCHAGNMYDLYHLTRSEFVSFYNKEPLAAMFEQLGIMDKLPEYGELEVEELMESDNIFC